MSSKGWIKKKWFQKWNWQLKINWWHFLGFMIYYFVKKWYFNDKWFCSLYALNLPTLLTIPPPHQDDYIVSYSYNLTDVNNEQTRNVTCPTTSALYCQLPTPGIPGQAYDVRVYSVLGTAVSDPTTKRHSTSRCTLTHRVTSLDSLLDNTKLFTASKCIIEIGFRTGTMAVYEETFQASHRRN